MILPGFPSAVAHPPPQHPSPPPPPQRQGDFSQTLPQVSCTPGTSSAEARPGGKAKAWASRGSTPKTSSGHEARRPEPRVPAPELPASCAVGVLEREARFLPRPPRAGSPWGGVAVYANTWREKAAWTQDRVYPRARDVRESQTALWIAPLRPLPTWQRLAPNAPRPSPHDLCRPGKCACAEPFSPRPPASRVRGVTTAPPNGWGSEVRRG